MASRIQIKRTSGSTAPATSDIEYGELAYSAFGSGGGGILYTRDAGDNIREIGGDKYVDLLDVTAGQNTASKALITDGSNKINQLLTTNITVGATDLTFGGTSHDIDIPANSATALAICDGAVNLMTFDTTTGSANVNFGSALASSALTACAAAPVVTIKSTAVTDAAGDRPSTIDFKGGGDEILGRIKVSHDGTSDDAKGKLVIYTNDGSAANTPDAAVEIDSNLITCFLGNVEVGSGSGASAKDLKVWGDLQVEGDTTTINTAQLTVEDDLITVSKGNDTVANADGSGVEIDVTGESFQLYWKYVHANTAWASNVDINLATTSDVYKIAGTSVLNHCTLGSGVTDSSLTSIGTLGHDLNLLATTEEYQIATTSVLSHNTLGAGVLSSSLTSVGILNSGSINTGFGHIDNGESNLTSGGIWKVDADYVNPDAVGSLNFGAGGGAADANMGYDGTDFKFNVVSGSLDITASGAVDFAAPDMTLLDANNNGNPTFTMGSTATNALIVTSNYHTGAQTLDNVTYAAPSSSAAADAGKHVFSVDDTALLEIRDSCLHAANGTLAYELNNFKIDGGSYS
jgi:hypothetical protein